MAGKANWLAGQQAHLVDGLASGLRVQRTSWCALMAGAEPLHPCGARIVLHNASPTGRRLVAAARKNNPKTTYPLKSYPARDELKHLVTVRFCQLEVHDPATPVKVGTIAGGMDNALALCCHPSISGILAAFGVLYTCGALTRGNNKALEYAWRRDMLALRKALSKVELQATEELQWLFGRLIDAHGVASAVLKVLEQAYEFERTVEYITASLALFKPLKGTHQQKGHALGDQDSLLVRVAHKKRTAIQTGNWSQHARLTVKEGKGRLESYHASAPEGARYHLVLGGSALEFIVFYLLQAHWRFSPFAGNLPITSLTCDSAILRVAINVLAHIDVAEARSEILARVMQSPSNSRGKKEDREARAAFKLPSGGFRLFEDDVQAGMPWADDGEWGSHYVQRVRQKYRGRIERSLNDEVCNPFARAFPWPEAWSMPRESRYLASIWTQRGSELAAIDPRYAPPRFRGTYGLTSREQKASLASAAVLMETPSAISVARSFGLCAKVGERWI